MKEHLPYLSTAHAKENVHSKFHLQEPVPCHMNGPYRDTKNPSPSIVGEMKDMIIQHSHPDVLVLANEPHVHR